MNEEGSQTETRKQLLWMHQNLLTALPSSIGALTNLAQLSLDDNQATSKPKTSGKTAPCRMTGVTV